MFTSAIFSFFFYVLVFLRMRGNIVVVGRYVSWRWKTDDDWRGRSVDDRALGVAKQMLLYPVCDNLLDEFHLYPHLDRLHTPSSSFLLPVPGLLSGPGTPFLSASQYFGELLISLNTT